MRECQSGADLARQLAKVAVAPHRVDALEQRRLVALAIPANAEAIAIRGVRTEPRVQALVDQRVLGLVKQVLEKQRPSRIGNPAAHRVPSCVKGLDQS